METPQAEIAAVPAPAPVAEAAPAVTAPASNPTPQPFFDAAAAEDALYGESPAAPAVEKPEAPAAEPAPAATPAAAPSEAKPAGETPPAAPEEPAPAGTPEPAASEPAAPEKILPSRISTKQFPPNVQKAMALFHEMKADGVTFEACLQIVAEENKQADQAAASEAERIAATPDPIATAEQEVAEIKAKLKEAGEAGSLMTPELAELQTSLAEKVADLRIARLQREQSQQEAQRNQESEVDAVFAESRAEMLSKYPSAAREGSVLYNAIQAEAAELQKPGHPDRHRLDGQPDAPKFLTQRGIARVANDLGISYEQADAMLSGKPGGAPTPKAAAPTPAQNPAPQPAAAMNLNPAAGNRQTAAPAQPPTAAELLAASDRPGFDYDAALYGDDSPALVLRR